MSAHVIANTCAEADALATAFLAMGSDNAKKLIPKFDGIEVHLVLVNKENEMEIFKTKGFEELLLDR